MFSVSVVPPGPVSVKVMGVPTGSGWAVPPGTVALAVPLKLMVCAGVMSGALTLTSTPSVRMLAAQLEDVAESKPRNVAEGPLSHTARVSVLRPVCHLGVVWLPPKLRLVGRLEPVVAGTPASASFI